MDGVLSGKVLLFWVEVTQVRELRSLGSLGSLGSCAVKQERVVAEITAIRSAFPAGAAINIEEMAER